jgi:penicillin-binding protein 1C
VARGRRAIAGAIVVSVALAVPGVLLLAALERAYPPDLARSRDLSRVLVDRAGTPLRYALTADDRLRLATPVAEVDPKLLALLIAYEDKRYFTHSGVDPLAVLRALGQWLRHGHPVSGASTLTMQTVRLLEPRPRTLATKLVEMLRAWQLERRLDKHEILALYLTLAPYGGNVEGLAAATRYYLGKSPRDLTLAEAALLVALPQSPTRLRPDRHPRAALTARAKVLERVWPRVRSRLGLDEADLALARREPIALHPAGLPMRAPHLADRLLAQAGAQGTPRRADAGVAASCLDASLQRRVERIARDALADLHRRANVAALVVHNASGETRAYVGGADYLDAERAGQLDLTRAVRSPGSTLKPLVYGLAFDARLIAPATRVEDAPTRFGGYAPANFEGRYHGTVSVADALSLSLNVPAVAVLDALGPARFVATLARHGTPLGLPDERRPGLAIALGGAGSTLSDLVRLYRAIADDGRVRALRLRCDRAAPAATLREPLVGTIARWHLRRILGAVAAPQARAPLLGVHRAARLAYKTGTSYGYRDAWAIGFDAMWTVGIWVGRPDGTPVPGQSGYVTAAPILFRVFDELPQAPTPATPAPRDALLAWDHDALPPALRELRAPGVVAGPRVLFPLPGTTVLAGTRALPLEARGGAQPYTWLIDGVPLRGSRRPTAQWRPTGPGFVVATVVDRRGRADRVRFRVSDGPSAMAGRLRREPSAPRANHPRGSGGQLIGGQSLEPPPKPPGAEPGDAQGKEGKR